MSTCRPAHQAIGVTACAFGDIFLEDLKRGREENLAKVGLRGIFPLWRNDTRELIRELFTLRFGTVIGCVNEAKMACKSVEKGQCLQKGPRCSWPRSQMGNPSLV
jgi:diphthamide synthase (EF-2-diphthine--ammonia ligase)